MTFKERSILLFDKGRALQVFLFHSDKRMTRHIVRLSQDNTFTVGEAQYTVKPSTVFYAKGLPTLVYNVNDPSPADPENWDDRSGISSREFYDAMEEKVGRDIIRYASEGDQKLINTLLMGAGVLVVGMGIGFYMVLENVAEMNAVLTEYEVVLGALRSQLLEGGLRP